MAEYPFRLKNGWRQKETLVTGIQSGSALYGLSGLNGNRIDVPEEGILLTEGLARAIGVKPGDTITLESLYKPATEKQVVVKGLVEQYMGGSGFMEIESLNRAMNEGSTINSALIKVRRGSSGFVKELEDMAYVQSVKEPDDMVKQYYEYMEIMYVFIGVIVTMSCIMGFAIIYNTTTISIMERRRELFQGLWLTNQWPSLYSKKPTVSILELWSVCRWKADGGTDSLLSRGRYVPTPVYFQRLTFWLRLMFVILAQLANMRRISRMDLVEVMKSRE